MDSQTNQEYAQRELDTLVRVADKNLEVLEGAGLPIANDVRYLTTIPENLPEYVINTLHDNMNELGFGSLEDRGFAEAGMIGAVAVLEGGRVPIKLRSELAMTLRDKHGPIVFTGTRYRKLDAAEVELLGIEGTEFDAAVPLMQMQANFESLLAPVDIPFSYELILEEFVDAEGKTIYSYSIDVKSGDASKSGQAQILGNINGQPVCQLEVARLEYIDKNEPDPNKQNKYFQPNAGELAVLTAQMLEQIGIEADRVATVTGGIYAPTRSMDIIKVNQKLAAEGSSLLIGYTTYGRKTVSEVTGEPIPERPPLNQLISEVSRLEVLRQTRL